MTFLKYELAAILGTAITIAKARPQLASVPLLLKAVHYLFVGVFSVIGAAGFHITVWICFRHREFIEAFSHSNPFGVSTTCLQYIGYGFAPAGAVLCVAALRLGGLRNWARRTVIRLALPYSILYPGIMSTVSNDSQLRDGRTIAFMATMALSVLAVSAMFFYSSKLVEKHLAFK